MLRLEDVVVRYGKATAVKGLTLEVDQGEMVGLIGPNGAGKTTTLGAIMGFQAPASGSVVFDGEDCTGRSPEVMARSGVALVPEGNQIFGSLTVAENLELGATVRPRSDDLQADLDAQLTRFPRLRERLNASAAGLSGGERQQLAIARALLSRPTLLLLDEPSLGLAPMMVDVIFDTLAELKELGMTILLVEQNALRTVELADRTYVLRSGSVTLSGTRDELSKRTDLASHYLGL